LSAPMGNLLKRATVLRCATAGYPKLNHYATELIALKPKRNTELRRKGSNYEAVQQGSGIAVDQ
jgi:hypothetical protein